MLNAGNKVNYEVNVKKEERKYSWSTVFTWLYLKTIGQILPKRWNKWAEDVLYYDKSTVSNEIQTDVSEIADESVQVDLKLGVAEKGSQSEVASEDKEVQTESVLAQESLSEENKEVEQLQEKLDTAQYELADAIQKLKDKSEEKTQLETQLDQQKQNSQSLIVERDELQEELENLRSNLARTEGEKREL